MEVSIKKRGRPALKKNDANNLVNSNTADAEQPLFEPPPLLEDCRYPLENQTSNKVNTIPATPEAPVLYMVGQTPRVTNQRSEAMNDRLEKVDRPELQNGIISSPIMRNIRITTRNATQSTKKITIKKKTLETKKLKLQTKLVSVGSPSKTAVSNSVEASITSVTQGEVTSNKSNTNNVAETEKTVQTSFKQPTDLDSQDTQFDELQLIEASKSTVEPIITESVTAPVSGTQEIIGDDIDNKGDAGKSQEAESTSVLLNEEKNGNIIGNDEEKSDSDNTSTWEFSPAPPPCFSNGRSILRSLSATKVPNDNNHCMQSSLNSKVVESKVEFAKVPHKRFFDSKHSRGTNRGKTDVPRSKKRKRTGSNPQIEKRLEAANLQLGESLLTPTLTGFKLNPSSIGSFSSANTNFQCQESNNQVIIFNGNSNLSNGFDTSNLSKFDKGFVSPFGHSSSVFSQINDSADIFVESQVGIGTDYNKIIFPELQTCEDSITSILKELTCTPERLESVFSNLNIKTIGDLCGRTKAEINQFPIRCPKEFTLKLVLEKYLKMIKTSRTKLITAPIKVHVDSQSNRHSQSFCNKLDSQTPTSQSWSAASYLNNQNHQGPLGNARMNNSQTLSSDTSIFNLRTESSLNSPILPQSESTTNTLTNGILTSTKETGSSFNNDSDEYNLPDGYRHTNASSTLNFGNLEVIDQLQKFIQGKHGEAFLNQLLSDATVADKVQSGMISRWHDADEKIVKAKKNQKSTFKNLTEMSINCLYQEFVSRNNDQSTLSSEFWNKQLLLLFTSYNDLMSARDNENDKSDIQLWVKIVDILKKQHPHCFNESPSDDNCDSSMANCVKYMINSFSKCPEAALIPEKDILTLLPDLLKMMSPEAQSRFFISRMKFF